MKRLAVLWVFIAVIMMFAAVSARAAEILTYNDDYQITLGEDGSVVQGGGTGYENGEWYIYDSGWINQWFYNGPFDPFRWKHIEGFVDIMPLIPEQDYAVDFVINWATPEWDNDTGSVAPPLPWDFPPEMEDMYIGRELIFSFDSAAGLPLPGGPLDYVFDIMSFNPEWISIDVMGYNVDINGVIMHQCIPEPATLSLLALGGVAVLARRRKS